MPATVAGRLGFAACSSSLKKWWKYLTAKLTGRFDERADPKVQLEQAITEAQDQHRRLKEQAANVIANQKQSEIRLNGKMTELEKLNANARQALIMAADAEKAGDADKAAQYTSAAETIANQLIQVEKDVESLKTMVHRVDPGVRPGQGRRRSRTAGSCSRSSPRSRSCCRSSSRRRCRKR